jgi:predicted short-subunit dehydrogenase-like oxidoreductase (DUF2520 family)
VADPLGLTLALAGPGRAGRAFARSWIHAGGAVAFLVSRDRNSLDEPELAAIPVHLLAAESFPSCDALLLAVPDDAISDVAERLAGRLSCRHAFHLAGALESHALAPFRREGAAVASLHPVRPFTGSPAEDWKDAFVAVEGDPAAAELGASIVRAVGARAHRIAPAAKPLYHAGASLAAGGTVGVLSVAVRAWCAAGIPEDVARETLAGLSARAASAAARAPFAEAVTGAVARRDVETVRAHVRALLKNRDALLLYRVLAREILDRTAGRGREEEILAILQHDADAEGAPPGPAGDA